MDLREIINVILIICASGLIFVLPSSIYTAMFLGIFCRQKPLLLDSDDLKGTAYDKYKSELCMIVTAAKQIECETVTVRSRDNLRLFGRYYDKKSDTTVLLVHGYQSTAYNNFSSHLPYFLSLGYNVLMVDQRAHGNSKGLFTTTGCKEQYDLLEWISWIEENGNCDNIFLYGISMGATTIGLASDKIKSPKVKGLIMEAGFVSFYEELVNCIEKAFMKGAALNYIVLCAKHLLKIDIKKRTTQSLAKTSIPALFLHGSCDTDVPLSHTEESFLACSAEKEIMIVEGADHTLCHFVGKETVENKIKDFIAKCKI